MNKITLLGTGTSTGVPILGCKCKVCQSTDPRNKRFRTSAVIHTTKQKNVLIDASPDLRTQLLQNHVSSVDAVMITHDHADHTHGMDDLRAFTFDKKEALPIYTDEKTSHALQMKYPYIFQRQKVFADKPILGGGIPMLDLKTINDNKTRIAGEEIEFHALPHGHETTLCVRHRGMGYITDCREIPEPVLKKFRDAKLEILILDCLRLGPHQTHLHLDLALRYKEFISPELTILTHMGHELEYLDVIHQLKIRHQKNVFPGMDGQSFYYS